MAQKRKATAEESPPYSGSCYGHGWRQMWKYFFELLLVLIVLFLVSIPSWGFSIAEKIEAHPGLFFIFLFSLAYVVLVERPMEYGASFVFLKAARGDRLEVKDMFDVFKNYGNAILAHLLSGLIIGIGFVLLIVPGIVFACKLAFVPYLIVDRKMDAIEAVKTSWRMTTGHAFTIFLIGFIAIFVAIVGLICFGVGIIVSIIWIKLAFASLYHSVSQSKGKGSTKR